MNYNIINMDTFSRKEKFNLYYNQLGCTYSLTVNLDIKNAYIYSKNNNINLYPILIWAVAKAVNNFDFMRIEHNENKQPVIFDILNPSYTVLNSDTNEFFSLYTQYNNDFNAFYNNYLNDINLYKNSTVLSPKKSGDTMCFDISSLPWIEFTSFDLSLKNSNWLLPIFTTGKLIKDNDDIKIPFNVKVHHAVCDGFHLSLFLDYLQQILNEDFNK